MRSIKKAFSGAWGFVKEHKMLMVYVIGLYIVVPALVWAWSNPSSGSFAYDVYDIAISKIAKGPIGFVAGATSLAGAIFAATRSAWVMSGCLAIGAGLIYKLDTIANSLGFMV